MTVSCSAVSIAPRNKLRGGAALREFRLRLREGRDAPDLFCVFDQPQCRLGLVSNPIANLEQLQRWLNGQSPSALEIVATRDDAAIAYAGLFPGSDNRSHVGAISVFVMMIFMAGGSEAY